MAPFPVEEPGRKMREGYGGTANSDEGTIEEGSSTA